MMWDSTTSVGFSHYEVGGVKASSSFQIVAVYDPPGGAYIKDGQEYKDEPTAYKKNVFRASDGKKGGKGMNSKDSEDGSGVRGKRNKPDAHKRFNDFKTTMYITMTVLMSIVAISLLSAAIYYRKQFFTKPKGFKI